mmetsp:Transcript_11420/g.17175  ORF Transcript_11420/g.17175 Transcript_11420/m.17175 type:complete len:649 (-) Transcript_11420:190-2136(-)|eukprot:CAMPEP_0196817150 /NCGR_PEP_ID=MMETSP1362-20130617/59038_1 /TAXON_ID=163516 /ORGANISM="Leptocylindrus danicus, Strain CCMP1856" /LENGTH=648 /DNA_ID=CAMNT_0042194729 /DNA_START=133 /DNA_END=2079 /DNA_ORIENTATION=-
MRRNCSNRSSNRIRTSRLEGYSDSSNSQCTDDEHEQQEEESQSPFSLSEVDDDSSREEVRTVGTGRTIGRGNGDDASYEASSTSNSIDIDGGDSCSFNGGGGGDGGSVDSDEEEYTSRADGSEAEGQAMLAAFIFAQQMYQQMHLNGDLSDDDDENDDTDEFSASGADESIGTGSSQSNFLRYEEGDDAFYREHHRYETSDDEHAVDHSDETLRDSILLVLSDMDRIGRDQIWESIRNIISSANGTAQSQLMISYDYWDPMGTLLHVLCYHDPPADVVEMLLQIRDEEGNLCGSEEMCRYGNEDEDTPLHIACRHNASIEVLQLLVNGHIFSLYSENDSCNRPIDELCRRLCEMCSIDDPDLVDTVALKTELSPFLDKALSVDNSNDENLLQDRDVHSLLMQAEVLIQMSNEAGNGKLRSIPTLHAAICTYCPLPILLLLLKFRPEHASMRDLSGRVPLLAFFEESDCNHFGDNSDDSSFSFELIQYFLDVLIETNPNAARMSDDKGRIALNVAVSNGWSYEILRKILDCAPRALVTRDMPSGLYPFMLAASSYAYGASNVCTTYRLLREEPLLMRGLKEDPPWLRVKKINDENDLLKRENEKLKANVNSLTNRIRQLEMTIAALHSEDDDDRLCHSDHNFSCVTPEK